MTHSYRYRMNENIVLGSLVNTVQSALSAGEPPFASLAAGFEQKAEPMSGQLKQERTILRDIKPFKNVVVVVYESVRWRDLGLKNNSATTSPNLARMASQGILSKSYVSVPHSSKAYFAILSGRHPYPGVEMREVLRAHHDSVWHEFSRHRNGTTFAFSSLFLGFENMGGLLKSLGIDQRFQSGDLEKAAGAKAAASSSFGMSDELLYALGAQRLSKTAAPFAAIFFPMAAHYPYECPGAIAGRHSYTDYTACVKSSDKLLAKMIEDFRRLNSIKDTLFVIVGDHGESFGEHGLFVHNSSLYEEEVTVPLIFWSDDGRLAHHFIPVSRQIDIAPTIADLLGMMNSEIPVQGVSLLRRNGSMPPVFMSTFFEGVGQALVEPPYKYIYESSADRLLAFDLNRDPNETSPEVIADPKKRAIVARLRAFQAYQELAFPRH
jgi:phosphoglycerol transferase MdoB-like AlkP superfamily enzyme